MGYPMTFQRVVNRNGLKDGSYEYPPSMWFGDAEGLRKRAMLLAGDLRRLENDALDEQAICGHIADRTGIDRDTVAAVLKEFISW